MRRHLPTILTALAVFAAVVVLAASYWHRPLVLALILVGTSGLLFARWHRLEDVIYYGVAAIVGPAGELIAIQAGAWSYAGHGLAIPLWLPAAWGVVGVSLRRLCVATVEWVRS